MKGSRLTSAAMSEAELHAGPPFSPVGEMLHVQFILQVALKST